MDWFMLTAMGIAGWAVVSVLAGERLVRHHQQQLSTAAAAAGSTARLAPPTEPTDRPTPIKPASPRRAAA